MAKNLNIYNTTYVPPTQPNSPVKDVLSRFSDCVVDFAELRMNTQQFLCRAPRANQFEERLERSVNQREVMQDELLRQCGLYEQWLSTCIGQEITVHNWADQQQIEAKMTGEWKLHERLGIFIPVPFLPTIPNGEELFESLPPFTASQAHLEWSTARLALALAKYRQSRQKLYADASALQEVQKELHQSLWQSSRPASPSKGSSKTAKTKAPGEIGSHLISTIDEFNSQQRVDQVSHYLEVLNHRAVAKKKLLQTLMGLWCAAKELLSANSPTKTRRPTATREEIILQTKALQDRLLLDMQSRPTAKTEQVRRNSRL